MTIYDSERIQVKDNPTSAQKVTLVEKFMGGSVTLNKQAFIEMCIEVAEKEKAKEIV